MGLLAALQFLTVLPVKRDFTDAQVGSAASWFPVVGIFIGLALAGLYFVLRIILPAGVVDVLLLTVLALFSGGLHLDGLADTMDGMAGHRSPEHRLEIMRDSRIGGIGAVGLALFLILEYAALNNVSELWVMFTLVCAPMMSRMAMVDAIYFFPYARQNGLGSPFKQSIKIRHVIIAAIVTLAVSLLLFRVAGLIIAAVTWLIITLAAVFFKSRLNGLTGDTYGAINEIAFTAVLLTVCALTYTNFLL